MPALVPTGGRLEGPAMRSRHGARHLKEPFVSPAEVIEVKANSWQI